MTVTDLRPGAALQVSLQQLDESVRVVLGSHRTADFTDADLVVKNPAVPATSPFLQAARNAGTPIETDISLFRRLYPAIPVLAVTGSKGKSTTAAALHHGLRQWHPAARLGGNITSPLSFVAALTPRTRWCWSSPRGSSATCPTRHCCDRGWPADHILPDHQDRYPSLRAYARDKLRLFSGQSDADYAILGIGTERWIERPLAARSGNVAEATLPAERCGAVLAGSGAWLQLAAQERQPWWRSACCRGTTTCSTWPPRPSAWRRSSAAIRRRASPARWPDSAASSTAWRWSRSGAAYASRTTPRPPCRTPRQPPWDRCRRR